MRTVPDIIRKLGGPTKVGLICGFNVNACARGSDMIQRNAIPRSHWPKIVEAARQSPETRAVTMDLLERLHAKAKTPIARRQGAA